MVGQVKYNHDNIWRFNLRRAKTVIMAIIGLLCNPIDIDVIGLNLNLNIPFGIYKIPLEWGVIACTYQVNTTDAKINIDILTVPLNAVWNYLYLS